MEMGVYKRGSRNLVCPALEISQLNQLRCNPNLQLAVADVCGRRGGGEGRGGRGGGEGRR